MRWIDNMTPQEIENRERIQLQQNRIDACNTLIDHILDDIPHKDQRPLLDLLLSLRGNLLQ